MKIGRYEEIMLLFPYAKDIEYADGQLGLVIQFIGSTKTTDISIKMGLDDDLSGLIQKLMDEVDEV